jgi:hypothetical protein
MNFASSARFLSPLIFSLAVTASFALSSLGCSGAQTKPATNTAEATTGTGTTGKGLAAATIGSSDEVFDIIDAHVHPRFTGKPERNSGIPVTREEFVREMKEAHVTGAVALEGEDGKGYDTDLESLNVIRCAGVAKTVDVARIEKGLKSGYYRCLKVYLGYVHQYAYDKHYEPAYKLAEKYDVPVVFHTGDTYSTVAKLKYSDPLTLDEVAVDHPKMTIVIAHCGNPWIESAAEVAYKNPNVYLDGSAFLIGDFSKKPADTIQRTMIQPVSWVFEYVEDPTKLMYGTDWPLVGMKDYVDVFKRAIPKEHWRAVFHDNAVRIFKLDKKPAKKM